MKKQSKIVIRLDKNLKKLKPWIRGTLVILSWLKLLWSFWTLIHK